MAEEDFGEECTQGKGIATCLPLQGQGASQIITMRLNHWVLVDSYANQHICCKATAPMPAWSLR